LALLLLVPLLIQRNEDHNLFCCYFHISRESHHTSLKTKINWIWHCLSGNNFGMTYLRRSYQNTMTNYKPCILTLCLKLSLSTI
jgi:hypothetical protein